MDAVLSFYVSKSFENIFRSSCSLPWDKKIIHFLQGVFRGRLKLISKHQLICIRHFKHVSSFRLDWRFQSNFVLNIFPVDFFEKWMFLKLINSHPLIRVFIEHTIEQPFEVITEVVSHPNLIHG